MSARPIVALLDQLRHHVLDMEDRVDAAAAGLDLSAEMARDAEAKVAALRPLLAGLADAAGQAEADARKLGSSVHGRHLAAKAKAWRALLATAEAALKPSAVSPSQPRA